ncbi:Crp/Fnr family transcriptional regulator [Rhodoferax sp.]|uniref:Crp/Fnr family transcriptional regulator n=1 Tax=Rhodoferax sp. TaxID=50421 RepID=UPI00283C528A|nr:Crp/Fnr family transcriptional regulator [Rhodoferax sp.]MDR3371902.1 Crp/Fnr family transcriptional regulator [Rhodoferax sp.]
MMTELDWPMAQVTDLYPSLKEVQPSLADVSAVLQPMTVPADTVLFSENAACQGFPLVLDGEIKVSRHSGDGRSLELYRVVPGELCLVSSASLFRPQPLSAFGITTRPSTFLLVRPDLFKRWIETPAFRNDVLGLFAERMSDLTALVDAVAFHKLDRRLAAALLGRGQQLNITHQALADELGTVREIVTRLLRRFEREGWVALGREQITIVNSAALRALVSSSLN